MCKILLKKALFKIFIIFSIFISSAVAIDGHINQGGYNYNPSVIFNWDNLDNNKITKNRFVIKKINYQNLNEKIIKPIIIESSQTKNNEKNYVIVQHSSDNNKYKKPSYVSHSYSLNKKSKNLKKTKVNVSAKKVMKMKLVEMKTQKDFKRTNNVVVEIPRLNKNIVKNKNKQVAAIKMVPVKIENELNLVKEKKNIVPKITFKKEINNKEYANVGNPFDDIDAPNYEIESDNTIKSKAKKTKAPSYNPLTRYPLSDYTVKGVITSNEGNRALISTSQGNYFYIKEGELIGANKGVVNEIKDNSIIILQADRRIEIIISSDGRVSNR